jgi:phosphoenolpyruvate carboxykinase (GTP)
VRVLDWITRVIEEKAQPRSTPVGEIPKLEDLDLTGLALNKQDLESLFEISPSLWQEEITRMQKYLGLFRPLLPQKLEEKLSEISEQLNNAISTLN